MLGILETGGVFEVERVQFQADVAQASLSEPGGQQLKPRQIVLDD